MTIQIAITGVGALSPYGGDVAEICAGATRPHDRLALVKPLDSARFVSERLNRKLDRFTVLGLCAAGMALEDSSLMASGIATERAGSSWATAWAVGVSLSPNSAVFILRASA